MKKKKSLFLNLGKLTFLISMLCAIIYRSIKGLEIYRLFSAFYVYNAAEYFCKYNKEKRKINILQCILSITNAILFLFWYKKQEKNKIESKTEKNNAK